MAATLKWDGDRLMLGWVEMAAVLKRNKAGYAYHLNADDFISEPYQSKEDAMQDCLTAVRALLKKAGA